jgi:hypothetical protein
MIELDYMEYADDDVAQVTYVSDDLIASPVSQWKLNEDAPSTIVVDSMGNNNGNLNVNTEDRSVVGKINKGFDLNGVGDNINCGSNASLRITGDRTLTAWVRISAATYPDGATNWHIMNNENYQVNGFVWRIDGGTGKSFLRTSRDGASSQQFSDSSLGNNIWRFCAIVIKNGVLTFYLDGQPDGGGAIIAQVASTSAFILSRVTAQAMDGIMDDVRVYNFALSQMEIEALYNNGSGTEEENPPGANLQSYSEDTIKEQGSYSLKGIALITASLNATLTRTVDPTIDLTDLTQIKFDIRASRTGSNIKIGIHDSGGMTTEITHNITEANVFQMVTWDISGVSNANKDAIDSIIITIVNADANNIFYIDNIYAISLILEQLSESFSVADSWVARLNLSEAFLVADSLVKSATKQLAEAFSVADSWVARLNLSEAFSVADTFIKSCVKNLADTLNIVDSKSTNVGKSLNESFTITDSWTMLRRFTEALKVADSVIKKHIIIMKIRKIIIRVRGGSYESDIELED